MWKTKVAAGKEFDSAALDIVPGVSADTAAGRVLF